MTVELISPDFWKLEELQVLLLFFFLRLGQPRLTWNSWSSCFSHPSAEITGMHHHIWPLKGSLKHWLLPWPIGLQLRNSPFPQAHGGQPVPSQWHCQSAGTRVMGLGHDSRFLRDSTAGRGWWHTWVWPATSRLSHITQVSELLWSYEAPRDIFPICDSVKKRLGCIILHILLISLCCFT
jgi:hypothetical protein